jgi:hypothetical protein
LAKQAGVTEAVIERANVVLRQIESETGNRSLLARNEAEIIEVHPIDLLYQPG